MIRKERPLTLIELTVITPIQGYIGTDVGDVYA
jgi:hypothetical protein